MALLAPQLVESKPNTAQAAAASARSMTNDCGVTARGIPSCGAFAGGAYGSNSDVGPWEKSMGGKIGVRRTYWGASQVAGAVRTAKADAAAGRVPWMSFKTPYSWTDMAAGRGDAWARDLATKMRSAGGPVWVAVHHEPEGDGDVLAWKRMQERLAPIMRRAASNLGYSVILMGYHQFGTTSSTYSMDRIWPDTKVDVAGFDIYELYGEKKSGKPMDTRWKDFIGNYFTKIEKWVAANDVKAWGLAETGYSDPAAEKKPNWPSLTYQAMVDHGGVAFAYFNTGLHNKVANWQLNTSAKKNGFATLVRSAPRLR
ncbi:hypothetical protein [Nocardioides aequoreus]|uniref:hypothetical protein n=1 Tax=Nocardioides aequoreus TaxID=397278 RepID=UPI0012F66376|nr:hypothetical protein [Nocardioides aequoreus]